MRINRETVLVGRTVVKQHVPTYHEWMKDPQIQQQTASEPLSLDQEYEMQRTWAIDEDKLTFIVLARPEGQQDATDSLPVNELIARCPMVGDVNIFFNEAHDDEPAGNGSDDGDEEDDAVADSRPTSPLPAGTRKGDKTYDAECEIMIAERDYRRKGLAKEALQLLFHYATTKNTPRPSPRHAGEADVLPIPPNWLTCKISLDNHASIALFERLGFVKVKTSEVWNEVEMRLHVHPCDKEATIGVRPQRVERWPLEEEEK
ncbi:related to N-acetyltransferase [Pseudozyma flocculosa]|uniref:Related to N-acetyltransferase n=1 Tax=Pseudozyma flocculosa TaxID=84751 RepID=A0A5C3ETJ8_9BASI|nr:related to N-acetyltransferase [Pseudozyma flocculosa]